MEEKRPASPAQLAALQKARHCKQQITLARAAARQAAVQKAQKTRLENKASGLTAAERLIARYIAKLQDKIIYPPTDAPLPLLDDEKKEIAKIVYQFSKECHYCNITKIERIYNPALEEVYETTRQEFQRKNRPSNERFMYHGTPNWNINAYVLLICLKTY